MTEDEVNNFQDWVERDIDRFAVVDGLKEIPKFAFYDRMNYIDNAYSAAENKIRELRKMLLANCDHRQIQCLDLANEIQNTLYFLVEASFDGKVPGILHEYLPFFTLPREQYSHLASASGYATLLYKYIRGFYCPNPETRNNEVSRLNAAYGNLQQVNTSDLWNRYSATNFPKSEGGVLFDVIKSPAALPLAMDQLLQQTIVAHKTLKNALNFYKQFQ